MRIAQGRSAGRRPRRRPPAWSAEVRARAWREVREGGDAAVLELTERFDRAELRPRSCAWTRASSRLRVGVLEPGVLDGLRTAIANVRAVAEAQLREPVAVELPAGPAGGVAEPPVRRAGSTCPGGRAAYPSTVVMCAVTARAAGVEEIAVCAPPGPGGEAHPVILAACVLCGVTEVYRMGGAQAIAALAYGTESVPRRRRDRRARATATCRRPSARCSASVGHRRHRRARASSWWSPPAARRPGADRARPAGPGRARRRTVRSWS